MARLVAARLHAVAANLHLAPAARVALAGVEKKPAAGLCFTRAHTLHLRGRQEIARCVRQRPNGQLCIGSIGPPGPRQGVSLACALLPTQLALTVCGMKVALECL